MDKFILIGKENCFMPRITVCSGSNYCGSCIRCLLLEVEGREKRLREEIFNP